MNIDQGRITEFSPPSASVAGKQNNSESTYGEDTQPVGTETPQSKNQLRLTLASSLIGTALEWYDFYLYGTAAALVFGLLFFPQFSPLAGTLAAFGTYAVGFLVRPIGGLIFGHIGDKYGRKPVLFITLLLMGLSTVAIGLLPTFAQIGVFAPVLLIFLRMLQGLAAGAEFSSAIALAAERAPAKHRGYYASFAGVGIGLGVLSSAGIFALFSKLPEAEFLSWGWRVPFLLSFIAVIIGLLIRLYVQESPVFIALSKEHQTEKSPVLEMLKRSKRPFFVAVGARMAENTAGFFCQVWSLSYVVNQLGMDKSVPLKGVLIGAGLGLFTIPLFGALSDRIGRRPVYMGGAIILGVGMFPFFWALNTKDPVIVIAAIASMICIANYSMFSVQAAFFVELFESRTRISGISMAREISAIFAGGIAPLVASGLLAWQGGDYTLVAIYMMLMSLITIIAIYYAPETRGISIDQ